jgi:hypothetical protein
VDELMRDFRPGSQFQHEIALAAIAVVLETRYTAFADEYLLDLARLHTKAELDLSPRVAQLCRSAWSENRPRITVRLKKIGIFARPKPKFFWVGDRLLIASRSAVKSRKSSVAFAAWMDDAKA